MKNITIINLLNGDITQDELLHYFNANVSYKVMPKGIFGFVWCYDNVYNIFINKSLSYYKRKKTILHELAHIELNQLNQVSNTLFAFRIEGYEDEADLYLKKLKESL